MFYIILTCLLGLSVTIIYKLLFHDVQESGYKKVPRLRGFPLLGNTTQFLKLSWPVKGMSPIVYSTQAILGMSKLFKDDSVFQVNLGPVVAYMLIKASSVEQLLKSNTFLDKPSDYKFLDDWLGQGLLISDAHIWKLHRKMLTPSFHFKILDKFQPIIDKNSVILVQKLNEHLDGKPFEVENLISRCTLDIICETAMGYNLNIQQNPDSSYLIAINTMCSMVHARMTKFYLRNDLIFKLSPTGRKYFKSLKVVDTFINKVIADRKAEFLSNQNDFQDTENVKAKPFLDILLRQHIQDGVLSEQDVKDEVNTFMFAGHDTTAVALNWILFLIGHYSEVQDKMVDELREVLDDGSITNEHCKNMRYIECVIKESQRLYPSVPTIARKMDNDFVIEGMLLKKGSIIHAFILALHRDSNVFPNPELFDPDRFLPENATGRHPYAYVPFSAGPRNCIGQKFAMTELKTILAYILKNFIITSVDDISQIPILPEIVSRPAIPIKITIKSRIHF